MEKENTKKESSLPPNFTDNGKSEVKSSATNIESNDGDVNASPKNKESEPEIKKEEVENLSPELTLDILNVAIKKCADDNKVWEDISQEERWDYIKQARN